MSTASAPIELRPMETRPIEIPRAEADLIDRIAHALPEEVRAEYYRELHHCRFLPESDEMLRLLRAMQFLVLLIEQAPSRVAAERERLDKLLAGATENIRRTSAASEAWHTALERRLRELPAEIAGDIHPRAVAAEINANLQQEFMRSTIPQTAGALRIISEQMKAVSSEFATTSGSLGDAYKGAAEEARKAIAALKTEISEAEKAAARFKSEVAERYSKGWRWSLAMLASGCLILGLALGMMLERWLLGPPVSLVEPNAKVEQPAASPEQLAPPAPKSKSTR